MWFGLGWWLDELWGVYFLGGHESMCSLKSEPVFLGSRRGGIIAFALLVPNDDEGNEIYP